MIGADSRRKRRRIIDSMLVAAGDRRRHRDILMRVSIAAVAIDTISIVVIVVQRAVVAARVTERRVTVGDEDHVGGIRVVVIDVCGILKSILPVGTAVGIQPVDGSGERVVTVRRILCDCSGCGEADESHLDQLRKFRGVIVEERSGEVVDRVLGRCHTRLRTISAGPLVHGTGMVQDHRNVDGVRFPLRFANHVERQSVCAVVIVSKVFCVRRCTPRCRVRSQIDRCHVEHHHRTEQH